jgi:AAA+ ATPase superfamily predicted ATPase
MFIGREKEIRLLENLYQSHAFEFGIIHGRRRVGKTTLLKQFIKGKRSLYLLAQQANIKTNLSLFSKRYGTLKGIENIIYESFQDFFEALFKEKDLIVVIDEFTYLTEADTSIESILQGMIDTYKDTSTIKMIISGSEIGMYENLFSVSKPLFNRQTFEYHLKECDYLESSMYYPNYTPIDKIRAYAIFGGLPYYLSHINDQISIEDNIKHLISSEHARFANEITMLLHTELRSIQEYQSILQAIQSGSTKLSEIDSKSRIQNTAKTSMYVKKLLDLEIIEKEHRFLDSMHTKKYLYRIKNNFIAFYYHFIWRNQASQTLMTTDDFYDAFIRDDLDYFISLRFEKISEQFLKRYYKKRNHEPMISIGRYWYNDRKTKTDIEIDICVQTKSHIHIYECKWTNTFIDDQIMSSLKEKGQFIHATKYGAFSKHGFQLQTNDPYDIITPKDFFII